MPSDALTSCSIQLARPCTPGEAISVTLVWPWRAATPMSVPSASPGLSPIGTLAAQLCAICSAWPRSRATSRPMMAAGTMPKSLSTEKRPPMDGWPKKIRRKPSASERCCIFEPGSVMAMKRRPISMGPTTPRIRSKKCCLRMFGSSVLPDLLARMTSVWSGSIARSTAWMRAGSMESSTCSSGKPDTRPKVRARASAPSTVPPMPSRTACVNPPARTSSAAWRR